MAKKAVASLQKRGAKDKEISSGGKKVKVSTALSNKSHPQHKQAKGIISRIKDSTGVISIVGIISHSYRKF